MWLWSQDTEFKSLLPDFKSADFVSNSHRFPLALRDTNILRYNCDALHQSIAANFYDLPIYVFSVVIAHLTTSFWIIKSFFFFFPFFLLLFSFAPVCFWLIMKNISL